jgi:DNA-binding response OmpR family regulator
MGSPVLYVDDSALARACAARMLAERGVAVTMLASTEEAAAVDPAGFAAALLDIELGDGLGTDLAARLRVAAPGLPVAFLTAGGPEEALAEAHRIGPVFSKLGGLEDAIGWLAARAGP